LRIVLDTNAYSALLSGEAKVREILEGAAWIGLPVTVIGELMAGFLAGNQGTRNLELLDRFIASAGVEVLSLGRSEAERYGAIVKSLRERGTPIPTNDIWIAAAAFAAEARLLSRDRHFDAVAGLVRMEF
jgi:tRNA(fMet)-specific endonuclease VapC